MTSRMRLALAGLLALEISGSAAAQQQAIEEVLVLNFHWRMTTDRTITMDGVRTGPTFDILGVALGQAGSAVQAGIGSSVLKAEGFLVKFEQARLSCRGQIIVGVSSPYVSKLTGEKQTNDGRETLEANFASPLFDNQALTIKRSIDYARPEAAPNASTLLEQLRTKYGPPRERKNNTDGTPSEIRWDIGGGSLAVHIHYFHTGGSVPKAVNFYMGRVERGEAFVTRGNENQQICAETKKIDDKRVHELNATQTRAPRL